MTHNTQGNSLPVGGVGEPAFTPGPWCIVDGFWIDDGGNRPVARVQPGSIGFGVREEANARLIAAAPDLLEAARDVLERWDGPTWKWAKDGPTADLMHSLRAAIAKALGPSAQDTSEAHDRGPGRNSVQGKGEGK